MKRGKRHAFHGTVEAYWASEAHFKCSIYQSSKILCVFGKNIVVFGLKKTFCERTWAEIAIISRLFPVSVQHALLRLQRNVVQNPLVYTMDKCTLFAFNRCAALMLTTTTTTATTMATATTPPAFHIQVSPQKLKVQNGGKILYFKVSVVHREVHLYRFSFVDVYVQFVQVFARSMCDALHIN